LWLRLTWVVSPVADRRNVRRNVHRSIWSLDLCNASNVAATALIEADRDLGRLCRSAALHASPESDMGSDPQWGVPGHKILPGTFRLSRNAYMSEATKQ
jgi:hypothetical protein